MEQGDRLLPAPKFISSAHAKTPAGSLPMKAVYAGDGEQQHRYHDDH
jgi:hypothetical protein